MATSFFNKLILTLAVAFGGFMIALIPSNDAHALVPETVRTDLPVVLDGEVWDIEQVGDSVIVAGEFTQVRKQNGSFVYNQSNLFAYDINSGEFDESFRPQVNGLVKDIEVTSDGFFVGGQFVQVDGQWRERIAKFDNNLNLSSWQAFGTNARISTVAAYGNWVYFGGQFTSVAGNSGIKYLARANATTGSVDTGFKFNFGSTVGSSTPGVARVDTGPDGTLYVSYRHKTINGLSLPGMFKWSNGTIDASWTARDTDGSRLYDDVCDSNKIQPKDLEVSPSGEFLVVVHQGNDWGPGCDTAVRIPTDGNGTADWVSRGFDSIFSVAIEDSATVYIGGHFRYLVGPNAPTAYPGDPDRSYPAQAGNFYFDRDFIDKGYVVETQQIGALNASTGKARSSWDPGSNTQIGVLGLTVIDRGLLIGQHNVAERWDIVAGELTGRSAFFDTGEQAGSVCEVTILVNGGMQINWNAIGGVSNYGIRKNGNWIDSVGSAGTAYTDPVGAAADSYVLRTTINGAKNDHVCIVTNPGTTQNPVEFCTVTIVNSGVRYDWQDLGLSNYGIRRNGQWIMSVGRNGGTSYVDTGSNGGDSYTIRVSINGVTQDRSCRVTNPGLQPDTGCRFTVNANGNAVLRWDDFEMSSYNIIKNGSWLTTQTDFVHADGGYSEGDVYQLRIRPDGVATDISCI